MVYRLHALDLGWLVWIVGVDGERERESTTFIHAFIRGDGEYKVQEVGGVREVSLHGGREVKLGQIFLHSYLCSTCLWPLLSCSVLILLHTPYLDHDGSLRECTSDSCGERCLLTMGGMGEQGELVRNVPK